MTRRQKCKGLLILQYYTGEVVYKPWLVKDYKTKNTTAQEHKDCGNYTEDEGLTARDDSRVSSYFNIWCDFV